MDYYGIFADDVVEMFAETKSEIKSIFDEIRIAEDTIYALPDKLY